MAAVPGIVEDPNRSNNDDNQESIQPIHHAPIIGSSDSAAESTLASPSQVSIDGRWGEQTEGDPVSRHGAMEDFEEMRRDLSRLSLQKTRSQVSRRSVRPASRWRSATKTKTRDSEKGDEETEQDDFDLGEFLMGGILERRTTAGEPAKKVGVLYKNLTVMGVQASASFVKTLPEALIGTFGPDLYHIVQHFFPKIRFGKPPATRTLVNDFTGVVRDGEMMLVLGRPGAGCSTFLKTIANDRGSYAAVLGDVSYGGISAEEQHKHFRGEVNYNPEDDQHFATLTVWQTLKFSLMNKTKKSDRDSVPIILDALLRMFGISHTKNTQVGNEYVRGVSGGERKRVSIAETLASKSTVACWDNSTRGLDASTALDYAKSLRIMTDISRRTTFVTLYQAGEGIYELMDKVLVIDEGRMLFQGPANEAKQYF
ncbi:hypothetical protein F66182_13380, partial [Fusarium sp. NRRL 66182]